ncbi:MAG: M15 family metallopeptidase [Treponema sp.]|nr:M15 family metallopeptidase [Treponema sp.]
MSCFRTDRERLPALPEGKTPLAEDAADEDSLPSLAETIERLRMEHEAKAGRDYSGGGNPGFANLLATVIRNAELPEELGQRIRAAAESPAFILDLLICLEGDRHLRALVDKQHPLPQAYVPADLAALKEASYRVNRGDLMLRAAAAVSLEEMAAAALGEGVTLVASSAFRSYEYQVEVYSRVVREMGQEAADRESARPGFSQHQTGLVVDFGSIDNSFAGTRAGRWMAANASRFGWSLSFPDGYEAVTGYRWESWHYRYVGRDLAAFIDTYFGGIQQYALRFIHEWEKAYSGISKTPSSMCLG